ncbi:hypothetical protein SAMN02745229_00909 [Butyrivibrio fibrisolvens DSM 3071]|jgi:hypothetical protein|uniref:Uncharacterized protein n=1 Tax=Butyrivibrio fibrisolvens DSM 3071 TaxID=1121131 RepID=A0A1M5W591_BUTFI|nr:hypothetical protein [Butyrivibrio fibrisolvens]SHH82611.1 hypothetical protein SAMN02745229_00909 [Butyrivibrio fibrisolvens DSM 3071]
MEFSVSLQDALFDDKYLYIILISLLLASLICFVTFCFIRVEKTARVVAVKKAPDKTPEMIEKKRVETLTRLNDLDNKYKRKEIGVRETSTIISITVRDFLSYATGKEMDCSTLTEMYKWNSRDLTKLIGCLYGAEFSKYSAKDAANFLRDAKKLVAAWR